MGTKIDSRGESAARLARNIACVKYTLFCFNIVAWVSRYYPLPILIGKHFNPSHQCMQ